MSSPKITIDNCVTCINTGAAGDADFGSKLQGLFYSKELDTSGCSVDVSYSDDEDEPELRISLNYYDKHVISREELMSVYVGGRESIEALKCYLDFVLDTIDRGYTIEELAKKSDC